MQRCDILLSAALVTWALAGPAMAQPGSGSPSSASNETVIVNGKNQLPSAVVSHFVGTYTASSPLTDKVARWKTGICPATAGSGKGINAFVTRRVREVAAMAGAPVNASGACKPNIDIVFTHNPQALLDETRAHNPVYLGYDGRKERATMDTHAVQAWYATATVDSSGEWSLDGESHNNGVDIGQWHYAFAHVANVEGTRLRDGIHSELFHIVIVLDLNKVEGREVGPVADYIAMLALSHTQAFDVCQELPSITNLMSPGCDARRTAALSDGDLAYLRALYSINPDLLPGQQRVDIANRMNDNLRR